MNTVITFRNSITLIALATLWISWPVDCAAETPSQRNQLESAALTQEDETPKQEDKPKPDKNVTDTKSIPNTASVISDNHVRFHMWDGSIIAGDVQLKNLSIETEFGMLQVPVQRIRRVFPGLDSFPELNQKVEQLVKDLGDKDFETREKSHRELASMGMQIRNEIDKFKDGGSAERKKTPGSNQTGNQFNVNGVG